MHFTIIGLDFIFPASNFSMYITVICPVIYLTQKIKPINTTTKKNSEYLLQYFRFATPFTVQLNTNSINMIEIEFSRCLFLDRKVYIFDGTGSIEKCIHIFSESKATG